jgi:hypothetical protein
MAHEEVPRYGVVAEAVERQDLRADVCAFVGAGFEEKNRVASTGEVGSDCACLGFD